MRWKSLEYDPPKDYFPWFAWYPVYVKSIDKYVWLETILRKDYYGNGELFSDYKLL